MPTFNKPVYICAAKRTAIASFAGGLSTVSAPALAASVIKDIVASTQMPTDGVDQVILGSVLTAGVGQAPARQALIQAGLSEATSALTVNKVCSSGLKAVALGATEISVGNADVVLAGGMESMSLAPYLLPALRSGARLGHAQAVDSIIHDGLWDPYSDQHMGNCGELCAKEFVISRSDQDAFALESYRRANLAIAEGWFTNELTAVNVKQGKNETLFAVDEEPGKLNAEKVSTLRPVFSKEGTITAANASSLSDGAAALLLCSETAVKKYNLTPKARIVGQGWHSQRPEWFTTAPVGAIRKVLADTGKSVSEIDLFEINEAFSCVAIACQRELKIDHSVLNVAGGAVALGHPIGASGARILVTLLHNLLRLGLRTGVAGICNGGGEATSMVIEVV